MTTNALDERAYRLERERYAAERAREREDSQRDAAVADAIATTTRELDRALEQLLSGCPIHGGRVELAQTGTGENGYRVLYRREYPGQGAYHYLAGYGPTPTAAILAAAAESRTQDAYALDTERGMGERELKEAVDIDSPDWLPF